MRLSCVGAFALVCLSFVSTVSAEPLRTNNYSIQVDCSFQKIDQSGPALCSYNQVHRITENSDGGINPDHSPVATDVVACDGIGQHTLYFDLSFEKKRSKAKEGLEARSFAVYLDWDNEFTGDPNLDPNIELILAPGKVMTVGTSVYGEARIRGDLQESNYGAYLACEFTLR